MLELWNCNGVLLMRPCGFLGDAIQEALGLALSEGEEIAFEAYGATIKVSTISDPEALYQRVMQALDQGLGWHTGRVVGP